MIIGKAYEVSVRILEVVAGGDVPNEQVDFSLETAIASPVDVQLRICVRGCSINVIIVQVQEIHHHL